MTPALAAPAGLRERKKTEAKRALVTAALELFGERGFAEVTVEAIADRANVSRRTFFRYFPTKEAVVMDRRQAQLEALKAHLAAAPASATPAVFVRAALSALGADYEANKRRILAERALFARSPTLALADLDVDRAFERAIADAVAPRIGRGEAARKRARMFAAALLAVLRVSVEDWADAKGRIPLAELGDEAVSTVLMLLGPAPSRAGGR